MKNGYIVHDVLYEYMGTPLIFRTLLRRTDENMKFSIVSIWVGCHTPKPVDVANEMTRSFPSEIEQFVWLNFQGDQSITLSIRCTFEALNRQCYLGTSKDHPISIDDTRLGIPLSEEQTSDGWVQVQGVWKPDLDSLSIDQVDLRIDKVLNTPPSPNTVVVQ